MRINLHHHLRRRQQIISRSLKISEGSEKKFYIVSKSILNYKRTRGCKQIQHINFQNVKRTRGCSHKYFRKLCNKCKTRNIFGQQTKEAHQHISFKPSTQHLEANFNNIFKENRRYFTSRTTHSSRTKHRDKNGLKPDQVNSN